MATATETIQNFMSALKNYSQDTSQVGLIALDEAVRRSTIFSSLQEATLALQYLLANEEISADTDTRLQKVTGIVLGGTNDLTVDTGAITGSNAGGSTVKNAQDIVPESGDLSTAELPTPGSTTPITYTGADGKSFTFYAKWPDSFTTVINCTDTEDTTYIIAKIKDSKYHVDLDTLDPNEYYKMDSGVDLSEYGITDTTIKSATFGEMKSAIQTAIKGLYNYWLREGAKLNYDSLGLALDGQTIEINFGAGGDFDDAAAITSPSREDNLPNNHIYLNISLSNYGKLNPTDPNGSTKVNDDDTLSLYLDRVVAHEMVHAVMFATGTLKNAMPQFFTEGIADSVQGDDDDNSRQTLLMKTLVNNPETLNEAFSFAEGTGGIYAYPAGNMFMRFIAKQGLNTTQFIGDSSKAETFSYDTKSAVITNYDESDKIYFDKDVEGYEISATLNDFIVDSPSEISNAEINALVVRDVRGKTITFNTSNGTAYAFMLPSAAEIDGKNFGSGNNFEILFGANYENDVIRAGNGGSYLWGGKLGNDILYGGNGADTFVYGYGDENDSVQNADSQDKIILNNLTLDKISLAKITDSGVNLLFTDGGSLAVNGQVETFAIKADDGTTTYRADYQTKTWQKV